MCVISHEGCFEPHPEIKNTYVARTEVIIFTPVYLSLECNEMLSTALLKARSSSGPGGHTCLTWANRDNKPHSKNTYNSYTDAKTSP